MVGVARPSLQKRHKTDVALTDPRFYINRELSWLEFNQQALDTGHPLLERVKFLSIVATNLDEFFMVRVATLLRKFRGNVEDVSPDGLNTTQQLAVNRKRTDQMTEDIAACWRRCCDHCWRTTTFACLSAPSTLTGSVTICGSTFTTTFIRC